MIRAALDTLGPAYLESRRASAVEPGAVCLFGAPYDGTTSFRPGARLGPTALRLASVGLEDYSPRQDRALEDVTLLDLGDLELSFGVPAPVVAAVKALTAEILAGSGLPLMLGGEHSVTPGAVAAVADLHPDLVVVQFDAHADLRPDYLGERNSHACAMRRCLDILPREAVLQLGIRSGTREEFAELRQSGRGIYPREADLRAALDALGDRPIYLTVDLDVFDPAFMPGTGTPEPGGIDWPTFARLLDALRGRRLVGADVVELAPQLDASGISAVLAAKVVREIILALG